MASPMGMGVASEGIDGRMNKASGSHTPSSTASNGSAGKSTVGKTVFTMKLRSKSSGLSQHSPVKRITRSSKVMAKNKYAEPRGDKINPRVLNAMKSAAMKKARAEAKTTDILGTLRKGKLRVSSISNDVEMQEVESEREQLAKGGDGTPPSPSSRSSSGVSALIDTGTNKTAQGSQQMGEAKSTVQSPTKRGRNASSPPLHQEGPFRSLDGSSVMMESSQSEEDSCEKAGDLNTSLKTTAETDSPSDTPTPLPPPSQPSRISLSCADNLDPPISDTEMSDVVETPREMQPRRKLQSSKATSIALLPKAPPIVDQKSSVQSETPALAPAKNPLP